MASKTTTGVFKQIEVLFQTGLASELTDGQLLDRFTRGGSPGDAIAEGAFAALVDRHGAMVLRVCRGVLNDEHAAEDAAQATFLVLARRAGSIARRDSIAAWLQGVAVRVASKARVAAIRRRIRERRVAEEASRSAEPTFEDSERWLELHQELGRLPETFRAPLVLCYLEGLTQEQAAARLRCPLGTVQSRLARGRERLKARLIGRGVSPISGFLVPGFEVPGFRIAPASWGGATTRAAIQFITQGSGAIRAGACPASAGLALEVLRDMGFLKLKIALTAILTSAMAATGAAGFWMAGEADPPKPAVEVAKPEPKPAPAPAPKPKPPADRVIAGIVRDDQGRPMAKVWVGTDPRPMQDDWENPYLRDIRERKEPFRNAKGEIVPPGEVGKYFELRDAKGAWHPISPDDIRPVEPGIPGDGEEAGSKEDVDKIHSQYWVRLAKGDWWMADIVQGDDARHIRTDINGRFRISAPIGRLNGHKLHFASPGYALQAIHVLKPGDLADQSLDISLKPTRLVRMRIIETPKDDPKAWMGWTVYTVDPLGKSESVWQTWSLPNSNAHDPTHMKRHLDVRLPAGRYRLEIRSETVHRLVDLFVPPGDGPLDLPDLTVESLATVQMVGKPAAEVHAIDLAGKPVKLADFRGKVIVLDFWANWCGPCVAAMPKLIKLQERFRDRPIVFLALHDGSVDGPAAYEKAVAPIKDRFWDGVDLPLRVLLDRPLEGERRRSYNIEPGSKGSGWSADTYEVSVWPSTFVIAADGTLVGKFDLEKLEGVLEDQLGLPRSKPTPTVSKEPPNRNVKVRGRVIGPDGKPVMGAHVVPRLVELRQEEIRTDANGVFEFTADRISYEMDNGIHNFHIKVEAANLAPKYFKVDVTGPIDVTLKLGVGVTITGRVMKDGKPVPGLSVGLQQLDLGWKHALGFPETKTDADGRFRFERGFPDDDLCFSVKLGELSDAGAVTPKFFKSKGDGTTQDLGDFEVKPGRRLAGRVVFSDGKPIPPGMTICAAGKDTHGRLESKVDGEGRFGFVGLPDAEVWIFAESAQGRGQPEYHLSSRNKNFNGMSRYHLVGTLGRDIDDLTILYEPGPAAPYKLDIGLIEDLKEARARTIEGVPPGSVK
jgi:RNA polymerase sigma-70 factor (ECF subfamily)